MSNISPPHDIEAEESVLGAILLSNAALPKLIVDVGLTAPAFYREQHGRIWDGMVALAMKGETVDSVTLRGHLEAQGVGGQELEKIGWLAASPPNVSGVLSYARRVIELAEWRQVLRASFELQVAVAEQDSEKRREGEALLTTARRSRGDTRTPEALGDDVERHLENKAVPAWSTPWSSLNSALGGGLRSGEVTLLGGWTSHGKSVVTDQLLRWCADRGAKVHAYINEMSPTMRALRNVSALTGVPQASLAQPSKLTNDEMKKAIETTSRGLPFGITQVTDWSAEDIARDIRFRGWDVCALDLVHRLPYGDEGDLRTISTILNAAAQTSGAHLIAVVHLNEGRAIASTLPPPVLRDIRGSGMLKNDADNVLFVHRWERDENGVAVKGLEASLYLAKCRNGRLEKVDVELDPRRSRFSSPRGRRPRCCVGESRTHDHQREGERRDRHTDRLPRQARVEGRGDGENPSPPFGGRDRQRRLRSRWRQTDLLCDRLRPRRLRGWPHALRDGVRYSSSACVP